MTSKITVDLLFSVRVIHISFRVSTSVQPLLQRYKFPFRKYVMREKYAGEHACLKAIDSRAGLIWWPSIGIKWTGCMSLLTLPDPRTALQLERQSAPLTSLYARRHGPATVRARYAIDVAWAANTPLQAELLRVLMVGSINECTLFESDEQCI